MWRSTASFPKVYSDKNYYTSEVKTFVVSFALDSELKHYLGICTAVIKNVRNIRINNQSDIYLIGEKKIGHKIKRVKLLVGGNF